jgi:hypothetical protein
MNEDRPTELELKLLMLLLMHGGEMTSIDEWWRIRRTVDPGNTDTELNPKGFTEAAPRGFRISAKGRRAVEEASCQTTG